MGILEDIFMELQQIRIAINSSGVPTHTVSDPALEGKPNGTGQPASLTAKQPAFDPFAGLPAATIQQQPAQIAVTDDQLMDLIEPHLSNPTLKTSFQQVLQEMAIARLPEAKPEQLPILYSKFSAIIQQHGGGQSIM
jgi:hypothetical protein